MRHKSIFKSTNAGQLDWFHWNLSVAWIAVMIELIVGTVPKEPPIRLLAMPVASMCFAFGVELLVMDIARLAGYKAPMRISSLPAGSPLRPGIYSVIEDVVAVDGGGGTEFRQRLNLRYMASHHFRQMLHRLTLFWAFGSCAIAVVTTVLIFTIQRDAAYVVSISAPEHVIRRLTLLFRSAGLSHSSGPEFGPGSPSSGCKRASNTNTQTGPKSSGRRKPSPSGEETCRALACRLSRMALPPFSSNIRDIGSLSSLCALRLI